MDEQHLEIARCRADKTDRLAVNIGNDQIDRRKVCRCEHALDLCEVFGREKVVSGKHGAATDRDQCWVLTWSMI